MQHITEIVPDLDTMPKWAREAFHDGQFFTVALARVQGMDITLDMAKSRTEELEEELKAAHEGWDCDDEKYQAFRWKPIETAPKDGTDILTFDERSGDRSVRYWGEGEDGDMAWQPRIRGCFPTHWMYLPPPLKKANG